MARVPGVALLVAAASLAGALPSAALAMQYSASLGYRGEWTDNAGRGPKGAETSDIIHNPRFQFNASHSGPSWQVGADYIAQRRIYEDKTFDGDTVLEGGANVTWNAIPSRLTFFAENYQQEAEIQRSGQNVPSNLQQASESSAGTTLTIPSFAGQALNLTYEYAETHLDKTANDSSRQRATASYVIPLSESDAVSLTANASRVNFDDPTIPEYETRSGSLAYSREAAMSTMSLSVGYESVDRQLGRNTVDGYTGNFEYDRQLTGASGFGISFSHDYRDNSLEFGRIARGSGAIFAPDPRFIGNTDISEVYTEDRAALYFNTQIGVNGIGLSIDATRQNYEEDLVIDPDRKAYGAAIDVSRPIRANLDGRLGVSYRWHKFDAIQSDDDEVLAYTGLFWQRSRRLGVGLEVGYFSRDQKGMMGQTIDEWSATLTIDYTILNSGGGP